MSNVCNSIPTKSLTFPSFAEIRKKSTFPPGALVDWIYENSHLPAPNLVIENPKNGHAHFVYELVDAVSFTERSSVKAQKYYKQRMKK